MPVETAMLTTTQAGQLMGMSRNYVSDLARTGKLDARRVGNRWLISSASALQYKKGHQARQMPTVLDDPEALARLYRQCGTVRDLAKAVGCAYRTACRALQNHNITKVRQKRVKVKPIPQPDQVDWIRWLDVATIFIKAGVDAPDPTEMCPPNCPGRDQCLDPGGRCVMADKQTKGE